jgi:hypothetical protein
MATMRYAPAVAGLSAALLGACGGTVVAESGGTTGGGGATGTTATAVATTSTGTSAGTGGASVLCGGLAGAPCPAGAYCAVPDQMCGGNDGSGTCTALPQGCIQLYQPVCGCDHNVYPNACTANAAGIDVDVLGGCTAPAGMFACGAYFCGLSGEFCLESGGSPVPGGPSGGQPPACMALPLSSCTAPPSCVCLTGLECDPSCETLPSGGLEATCQLE